MRKKDKETVAITTTIFLSHYKNSFLGNASSDAIFYQKFP
jgi:hypothetical protein